MLAMATLCQDRGHDVVIYTAEWQGNKPADMHIEVLDIPQHISNQRHDAAVIKAILDKLAQQPKRIVIGFKKMPGLDFYYAADSCFASKAYGERGLLYRSTARARQQLAMEKAVFGPDSKTHCLMISQRETDAFKHYYRTPDSRLHLLPPGIRRDRIMPADYAEQRRQLRHDFGLNDAQRLVLLVGSNYKLKGVDIAIDAIAMLPDNTHLWVAGQDEATAFERQAKKLGITNRVKILGARDDISQLMWAADALVHPAHRENTGTVLLEAMVAGLPVVASAACGYAHHVEDCKMGSILPSPVDSDQLAKSLATLLDIPRVEWIEKAQAIAKKDIFSMTERAAELIETLGGQA